jgi:hypothetical protein
LYLSLEQVINTRRLQISLRSTKTHHANSLTPVKFYSLTFGQHGVGHANSQCNTTKICSTKGVKIGKEKQELSASQLIKKKMQSKLMLIIKDGHLLNTIIELSLIVVKSMKFQESHTS